MDWGYQVSEYPAGRYEGLSNLYDSIANLSAYGVDELLCHAGPGGLERRSGKAWWTHEGRFSTENE